MRAIRQQNDNLQEELSLAGGIEFEGPGLARQEFKDEVDINSILARFAIGGVPHHPPVFGSHDFDLDLHTGLNAIAEAKTAHRLLGDELKKRYPTWMALLQAIESGELTELDGKPPGPSESVTEPLQNGDAAVTEPT